MTKRTLLILTTLLTGCPQPTPPPPPPTPTPPYRLIIVYESQNLTNAQGDVLNSKTLRDWLTADHTWFRFIDRDTLDKDRSPPAEVAAEILHCASKPLPHVLIEDAARSILRELPLPATDAELIAAIQAATGHP